MAKIRELPIPKYFDKKNAESWAYSPDQYNLFLEASKLAKNEAVKPAGSDKFDLHLLLIDVQKDFCFPSGTLYVGGRDGKGAINDSKKIAEFIYKNLSTITNITTTMDTHFAFQIFFPWLWLDKDGKPLAQHTTITLEDIRNGNYTWLLKQVEFYCEELERANKYKLYLWPPHCILGSDGHALVGIIHEARMFHSFARASQSWGEVKGGHPLTENYSILRPEVLMRWDGEPLAQKNTKFIRTLFKADAVVIAGQAASHCVKSSIDDLLSEILTQDPSLVKKVYIMTDCMSSVVVPDGKGGFALDYTPQAEEAYKRFSDAVMHLVKSTDPVESWPEIRI